MTEWNIKLVNAVVDHVLIVDLLLVTILRLQRLIPLKDFGPKLISAEQRSVGNGKGHVIQKIIMALCGPGLCIPNVLDGSRRIVSVGKYTTDQFRTILAAMYFIRAIIHHALTLLIYIWAPRLITPGIGTRGNAVRIEKAN